MKTFEFRGNFKDVKIFYNGENHEHSERSEGNEIKSIIIELDSSCEISELLDVEKNK